MQNYRVSGRLFARSSRWAKCWQGQRRCCASSTVAKKGHGSFIGLLSSEHEAFRDKVREYVDRELVPHAADWDKHHTFPAEQIRAMGHMGLLGVKVPQKWGGVGLDHTSLAIAVEEISRGCAGCGIIVSISNALYCGPVLSAGTKEQKETFLAPYAAGEKIGCFGLTEPGSGSDAGSITTSVVEADGGWVLNGTKAWITNACEADCMIVYATRDRKLRHSGISTFLVPMNTEGVSVGKKEDKLGIRASSTANVTLEDVKVPRDCLLGRQGDGFKIAMRALEVGRLGIAAQAIGIAQAALEAAVSLATRSSSSAHCKPKPAVLLDISDMATRLECARLMTYRAARLKDAGLEWAKEVAMAKLVASQTATHVTHAAMKVLGGLSGSDESLPLSRHYRDARITEIYGGTVEIQHNVIAAKVLKEMATHRARD